MIAIMSTSSIAVAVELFRVIARKNSEGTAKNSGCFAVISLVAPPKTEDSRPKREAAG
jgi:hypothetical protein